VGGPDVPSDVSLHKQIHLLMRRIENIESQADHDRVYYAEQNRTLNERVDSLDRRTRVADEELKEISRAIAVGTIGLQLWGLFLVGVGTMLMALPSIFN